MKPLNVPDDFLLKSFREVIDIIPCAFTIQDRSLRILFSNQAFINYFSDGTGKHCYTFLKRYPDRCVDCPLENAFMDGNVHTRQETLKRPDGTICQILVHGIPIQDMHGNIPAVVNLSVDITTVQQKQTELATLGQSISILSHSIKNILECLQGGVYVVDEGIKDQDMTLAHRGWGIVKKNITDITNLVHNILYASKDRPLRYERLSAGDMLEEAGMRFKEKADSLNVNLEQAVNPGLAAVYLDRSGIQRLLNNLILNAIEACALDPKEVSHRVTLRADFYDETHFKFEIEDNGIGMDEQTKLHIFKSFFSTKGGHGTGLGLSVVDRIVEKHGGRIEVDAAPRKGCVIRVIFEMQPSS